MKFKYILILSLLLIPALFLIGKLNYLSENNSEELIFIIPIVDDIENKDTIILTVELNIPKYYDFKQYIYENSDCITCGSQEYVFYKKPEKQTISEGDTVIKGFYNPMEKGRKEDNIELRIHSLRNVFEKEITESLFSNVEIDVNKFTRIKPGAKECKQNDRRYVLNKNQQSVLCLDFTCTIVAFEEDNMYGNIVYKNVPLSLELVDLTLDKKLKKDFYKIVESIEMKVEYKGDNKELVKLFNQH